MSACLFPAAAVRACRTCGHAARGVCRSASAPMLAARPCGWFLGQHQLLQRQSQARHSLRSQPCRALAQVNGSFSLVRRVGMCGTTCSLLWSAFVMVLLRRFTPHQSAAQTGQTDPRYIAARPRAWRLWGTPADPSHPQQCVRPAAHIPNNATTPTQAAVPPSLWF
jgi:hypothetical protein